MNEFNLEQFKKGVKARTRDGRIATFIGVCEECGEYSQVVAHVEGWSYVNTYTTNGTFMEYRDHKDDLVSMVSLGEEYPLTLK